MDRFQSGAGLLHLRLQRVRFVAGVARRFKQRHPGIYTALGGPMLP